MRALPGAFFAVLVLILLICNSPLHAAMSWSVAPSYETSGDPKDTPLILKDASGSGRRMYETSFAVLFVEGAYNSGGWNPVSDAASKSENLLIKKLEMFGFHVLVWRDLSGAGMRSVLDDMLANIGYLDDARLFFYYFGHGAALGTSDDETGVKTFLVPVDAPDPNNNLQGFRRTALPITRLTQIADAMTLKHAFFALEACKAGGIVKSLDAPAAPNPTGYIFSDQVNKPVKQFLTAGNSSQDVPANGAFTALLAAAISGADRNGDGFVYASDVIAYVAHNLPRYSQAYPLNPEYGTIPRADHGDFIFGPSESRSPTRIASAVASIPSDEKRLPQGAQIVAQTGHAGGMERADSSPSGDLVVTTGSDGLIKIWSVRDRRVIRVLNFRCRRSTVANFSSQSSLVAGGCDDGRVVVWNVESGRLIQTFKSLHSPSTISFSPDGGSLLVGGDDGVVRLFKIGNDNQVAELRPSKAGSFVVRTVKMLQSEASVLVLSGDGHVYLCDFKSLKCSQLLSMPEGVSSIAVDKDNSKVVVGGKLGSVMLATTDSGTVIWRKHIAGRHEITSVSMGGNGEVAILYDDRDPAEFKTISIGKLRILDVPFPKKSSVERRGISDGELTARFDSEALGTFIAATQRPELVIAAVSDHTGGHNSQIPQIISAADGKLIGRFQAVYTRGGITGLTQGPELGSFLTARGDGGVAKWNYKSGMRESIRKYTEPNHQNIVEQVFLGATADGRSSVTAALNIAINKTDLSSNEAATYFKETIKSSYGEANLCCMAVSENGLQAVTVDYGPEIVIWDVESAKSVRTIPIGQQFPYISFAVSLSKDGGLVAVGGGGMDMGGDPATYGNPKAGMAAVWEAKTGKFVHQFGRGGKRITGVALSSDGQYLLTGTFDGEVKYWSVASGELLGSLYANGGEIGKLFTY
jgi:WD40 repeat protein